MRFLALASAFFLAACNSPSTPTTPAAPVASAPVPAVDAAAPEPVAAVDAAAPAPPPTPTDPFAALPPSLPIPTGSIAKVKRSGTTWPFHKWDRAEVVVMNWAPYGPGTSMNAVNDRGWSPHVKYRAALDKNHTTEAVAIITKQHGELYVSKCPAPRHSVVLYDGDDPVASIDVCFTCHDVLLWPQWITKPTQADYDRAQKMEEMFIGAWHRVFIDDLKLPLWTEKP